MGSAGAVAVGWLLIAGVGTAGGAGGAPGGAGAAGGGHNCGVGMDMGGLAASETATAGSTVRITGNAFETHAAPVNITWGDENGPLLATVPVDEEGAFARPVAVPADARGPSVITVRQRVPSGRFFDPDSIAVHQLVFDVQEPAATDALLSTVDPVADPELLGTGTSSEPATPSPWLLAPVGAFGVAAASVLAHEIKRRKVAAPAASQTTSAP